MPCFNPYCAGFAVGSGAEMPGEVLERVFQSLLCWICCGKVPTVPTRIKKCVVSILIVLDLLWEVYNRIGSIRAANMFQSLLCWICCGKFNYSRGQKINICRFNPYCAGFAVGRNGLRQIRQQLRVFQSLLCWICCGKKCARLHS